MDKKPSGKPFQSIAMALVSLLFFLSLALRNPPLIILCHTVWALFLIRAGKGTEARSLRLFYALLGLYAMAVVVVQTVFLFTA